MTREIVQEVSTLKSPQSVVVSPPTCRTLLFRAIHDGSPPTWYREGLKVPHKQRPRDKGRLIISLAQFGVRGRACRGTRAMGCSAQICRGRGRVPSPRVPTDFSELA
jgi:hypothetical protein